MGCVCLTVRALIERDVCKEQDMQKIDINDIPVLSYDAGIPDTRWGETSSSAVTGVIVSIIVLLTD